MVLFIVLLFIALFIVISKGSLWEKAVILFTSLVLYRGILTPDDEILGFIDHRFFVSFFLIFVALFHSKESTVSYKYWDSEKKFAFILGVVFIVFYDQYVVFKDSIIAGKPDIFILFKRLLREAIFMFAVYHIIGRMHNTRIFASIYKGIYFGTFLAVLSMYSWEFFLNMGFKMNTGFGEENLRLTGLLSWHQNSTAGLLNIIFGYILGINERNRKIKSTDIILIIIILLGLLAVASKMGIVAFALIFLYYLYRTRRNFKKFFTQALLFSGVFIIVYLFAGDLMTSRIQAQMSGEFDTLASRMSHWRVYLTAILNNPELLLIGNLDSLDYKYAAHNTFIQILYNAGIFMFIWTIIVFYKTYYVNKLYVYKPYHFYIGYALLANIIGMITGAALMNIWLVLIIASSSGLSLVLQQNNYKNPMSISVVN